MSFASKVPENAVNCVLTMFGKCSYNETGCSDCEIKDKIHKALDEKQHGQWTPISEGSPNKNMACLVSVGDLHLTQIAMYSDLMGTISHKIFYQGDYGKNNFQNITEYVRAWMPLPEAYKEETDNE